MPTNPQASSVHKNQRQLVASSCRRSARLQGKPRVSYATPRLARSEQKRPQKNLKSNGVRSDDQPQAPSNHEQNQPSGLDIQQGIDHSPTQPQETPPSRKRLTEKNLRRFNREMAGKRKRGEGQKPSPLRSVISASEIESDSSQTQTGKSGKSKGTGKSTSHPNHTRYRSTNLRDARIFLHCDPPEDIQAKIDNIIKVEIPSNPRRSQLRTISQEFHKACVLSARITSVEATWVCNIFHALKCMNPSIQIESHTDWRLDLKPGKPQMEGLSISNLQVSQQLDTNDTHSMPPPKRQNLGENVDTVALNVTPRNPNVTPSTLNAGTVSENSGLTDESVELDDLFKTPRPDLALGFEESRFLSDLASSSLLNSTVEDVRDRLQYLESRKAKQGQAKLVTDPTACESRLVFPFLIVEAMAYATGNQIFEAQNQAAGCGACGLNMQAYLNDLIQVATAGSSVPSRHLKDSPPLFFSICTEGPIHELWVHFTYNTSRGRSYNMKIVKSCNAAIQEEAESFIVVVENVLRWGTGTFYQSVVDRLAILVKE